MVPKIWHFVQSYFVMAYLAYGLNMGGASHSEVLCKKVLLESSQKQQGNTRVGVFLQKYQAGCLQFY